MKWWLTTFAAMLSQAQPQQTPEAILLGKIQAKVVQNLSRLPNYTCSETIERFKQMKPGGKLEPLNTIRLEVAYVGGTELFGWPGTNKIDEPEIQKLVGRGTSGNGDFAIFPGNIFVRAGAKIYYGGETELDGKRAIRYNYRIPETARSYHLHTNAGEAFVGYEGSFWVDPVTLDLVRLTAASDYIPESLGLKSVTSMLDYSQVAVAGSMFLLPKSSVLHMTDTDGVESSNRTSFHDCREFLGQSVLKFESPSPEAEAPATKMPAQLALPDDFLVDVELETPIDSVTTAVGDQVRATLRENVKSNREIVIPKGAALTGNIVLLEKRDLFYLVALQFTSVEINGRNIDLSGREQRIMRTNREFQRFTGPMAFRVNHLKLSRGYVFRLRILSHSPAC